MSLTQQIHEIILQCSVKFTLSKIVGIYQTFLKQTDCLRKILLRRISDESLRHLHTAELILSRHLAFATLPRMERVGIKKSLSFLIITSEVKKSDLFQKEIITAADK